MSIATVVTRGYSTFGSTASVVVRGYTAYAPPSLAPSEGAASIITGSLGLTSSVSDTSGHTTRMEGTLGIDCS